MNMMRCLENELKIKVNKRMKHLRVFPGVVMVILLSGCTAFLWGGNRVVDSKLETHTLVEDNVTGVYQYKNIAVSALQGNKKISISVPSDGIAFIGEKNIYILTEGTHELLSLNKLATQIPLISGRAENTLTLEVTEPSDTDRLLQFSDFLPVEVKQSANTLSEAELKVIQQAGLKKKGSRYGRNVHVTGVIIPRSSLNYSFDKTESLGRNYSVKFYYTGKETRFHPVNLATNIVVTPLALAADIVFFPISLRVLGLISNPPVH